MPDPWRLSIEAWGALGRKEHGNRWVLRRTRWVEIQTEPRNQETIQYKNCSRAEKGRLSRSQKLVRSNGSRIKEIRFRDVRKVEQRQKRNQGALQCLVAKGANWFEGAGRGSFGFDEPSQGSTGLNTKECWIWSAKSRFRFYKIVKFLVDYRLGHFFFFLRVFSAYAVGLFGIFLARLIATVTWLSATNTNVKPATNPP